MKIEFYGAAGCVTGSCHILTINGKKILLDCGMYQGKDDDTRGNDTFSFNPKDIDYVILSHAHIDHSGRIPLLYKRGFKGEIITTEATKDLCSVMLPDSGHIQEMEVEWKNRKRIRQGLEVIEPLYDAKIAGLSLYLFTGYPYEQLIEIFPGFKIRFKDAGHLLGSAIIEMFIKEDGKDEVKLVYTGDLGNVNIPLIKDPTFLEYADYVIMETTYGNRLHDNAKDQLNELTEIIKDTFKRGGNVIIPSFAVGRAQEVIYSLKEDILADKLKDLKVFVDSPLATESTEIFKKYSNNYDDKAKEMLEKEGSPLNFEGLIFTKSPEESAEINKIPSGAIIISASGMCEAGRIRHHLKHNLWRKECSIIFVGYQAEGTLGRIILDGARKVKLFGEEIAVNAKIYNLQGLSGHADRNGLNNWLNNIKIKPKKVFLVHGDTPAQESFNELIKSEGFNSKIMQAGDVVCINEPDVKNNETTVRIEDVNRKHSIMKLLDSMDDLEQLSKEEIIKRIKNIL